MSEELKAEYFEQHLRARLGEILGRQREIFESRRGEISGSPSRGEMIGRALAGVSLGLTRESGGVVARLNYPLDIRFFDMKRILNWRIFNRKLWGGIYSDLLGDLRHEYSDWLRKHFPEELKRMGNK